MDFRSGVPLARSPFCPARGVGAGVGAEEEAGVGGEETVGLGLGDCGPLRATALLSSWILGTSEALEPTKATESLEASGRVIDGFFSDSGVSTRTFESMNK